MKQKLLNEKGYSLVEMVIAMMLLLIFGLAVFTLAASTSGAYQGLVNEKSEMATVRIASSYLMTKLRQSDMENAIYVDESNRIGSEALVIKEELAGEVYNTWIYLSGGYLREATVPEGETPSDDVSFEIAELSTLNYDFYDYSIKISMSSGSQALSELEISLKTKVKPFEE
jgi:competence protein ComGC